MSAEPPAADLLLPTYLGGPAITAQNCEREPIQVPGAVQPHGALLTADADSGQILQVSANTGALLGTSPAELRGQGLDTLLGQEALAPLLAALPAGVPDALQYRALLRWPGGTWALTAHRVGALLVLELEADEAQDASGPQVLRNAAFALEGANTLAELAQVAAERVRELTGFDRVMIYRFAPDASGEVMAEARHADLKPFLGHRFPESDIPAQARALYVRHLLRLTADTEALPAPLEPRLNPQTGAPPPLGGAVLRATSPMHLQYLRNMGVRSSLSVSLVQEGRLWGLIACHHSAPHVVPPATRTALEYLGRLLNLQLGLKARADTDAFRQTLQARRTRILAAAAHSVTPLETLSQPALDLPGLMRAERAVVFFEDQWRVCGPPLPGAQVGALLTWLRTQPGPVQHTEALGEAWPGTPLGDAACGLLAITVGAGWQEGVVWLRPALTTQVAWGGAPPEAAKGELGPRQSFDTYLQTVRGRAAPWHPGELEEAGELQLALTAHLGERLGVVRALNAELERANAEWRQYAFVIAHDLQEPVRLITQFADLFELKYRPQMDEGGERTLRFLRQETARLRSLTADLYTYTALLSAPPTPPRAADLGALGAQVLAELTPEVTATGAQIELGALPTVQGDPEELRTVLRHLLRNALTFGGQPPRVQVFAARQGPGWAVSVQDQGPGIAPEYHDKVFGLFQRLERREHSPGNGIGLALCRRIAERHGGRLTLQSAPGQGCTLTLLLPDPPEAAHGA
ncbi:ATP-binding protein [Deinococcus arcticus]|uniref:histidine kinase n=1 Tax=Deinococcus arcticus TaxID=2136176 RepID=A0A2T3W5P4_9DEIO|nr:ATP-binding protein [Deinococcus arcticus]PTA67215.1 histidine kinase [Deinococcus arcticus]